MNLGKLWEMVRDREGWCAVVHRVAKSWTGLSNWTELRYTCSHKYQLIYLLQGSDRWAQLHLEGKVMDTVGAPPGSPLGLVHPLLLNPHVGLAKSCVDSRLSSDIDPSTKPWLIGFPPRGWSSGSPISAPTPASASPLQQSPNCILILVSCLYLSW